MIKALKEYYKMVVRPSWEWLKRHWKGYLVLVAISGIVQYFWIYEVDVMKYIKSKFRNHEN